MPFLVLLHLLLGLLFALSVLLCTCTCSSPDLFWFHHEVVAVMQEQVLKGQVQV